jgi:hypothetical protein
VALIKCEECGRQVSDQAASCVGCGAPIGGSARDGARVTTQSTGKDLKAHIVWAAVAMGLGGLIAIAGDGGGAKAFGALVAVVGLIWYVVARTQIWWRHG